MTSALALSVLLLLGANTLKAAESDTVNERIPVRKGEMEAHWKVDCVALWRELAETVSPGTSQDDCGIDPGLRQPLTLCVYIHQPPGQPGTRSCPDYRGLLEQLESPIADNSCKKIAASIHSQESCTDRPSP